MNGTQNIHVSYILATFNRASYLDLILNNIREFIKPDDEVVIMDGGSTDNTPEIIKKYSDMTIVFISEKDRGPLHAYNKAKLKARGQIVILLTDDDFFYADGIRKAVAAMDENPEIDALVCGGVIVSKKSGTEELVRYQHLPSGISLTADPMNIPNYTPAGFLVMNRRIFSLAGVYDVTLVGAPDRHYMSQLLLCGANFKYLDVKLFKHCFYSHSFSHIKWRQGRRDAISFLMRHGEWAEIFKMPCGEASNVFHLNISEAKSISNKLTIAYLKICFFLVSFPLWSLGFLPRLFAFLSHKFKRQSVTEPDWDQQLR